MAKKTWKGWWKGQVKDRYQQKNDRTNRYDKYDGSGNFVKSKKSKDPWKSVEERKPKKPPRG